MEVKDSNGTILNAGDTVSVIKMLKLKGSSGVIKQGTIVKNIRLTDDEECIEGKVDGSMMVLRTEFLRKK
ncbi:alkylphosphonate utilization protein [soil metagenome]